MGVYQICFENQREESMSITSSNISICSNRGLSMKLWYVDKQIMISKSQCHMHEKCTLTVMSQSIPSSIGFDMMRMLANHHPKP